MGPVERASDYYRAVRHLEIATELRPSELWVRHIHAVLDPIVRSQPSAADVVGAVTEEDLFTYPRHNDDPEFLPIVHGFERELSRMGLPLETLDPLVQESHLASRRVTTSLAGRMVSTAFLYHLSAAWRVLSRIGRSSGHCTILELGGGFGGLARVMKLLSPDIRYVIVDLPEALWFSYTYLSANFPDMDILFDTRGPVHSADDHHDVVLVPVNRIEQLSGMRVAAVVNTASLGEMTDAATARYLRFIQDDIETQFLYSLNRYGRHRASQQFPGVRLGSPDCASVALPLDPFWRIHLWNIYGDDSFSMIETRSPPQLELLAERVPRALLSDDYRRSVAVRLLDEARSCLEEDQRFQFLLWESTRLFPMESNLATYVDFLEREGYVESAFYRTLRDQVACGPSMT